MPKFTVYEVQEITEWRRWRYEVEAESADAARELVMEQQDPSLTAIDCGTDGECEYGDSGWAVRGEDEEAGDPWQDASQDFAAN